MATAGAAKSANTSYLIAFALPSNASDVVLVAWCADVTLLPCPLTLRSPGTPWAATSCFSR